MINLMIYYALQYYATTTEYMVAVDIIKPQIEPVIPHD